MKVGTLLEELSKKWNLKTSGSRVSKAINLLNKKSSQEIKNDLKKFQSEYSDNELTKDLIEESKSISSSLDKVENELYQTKNQSNQDPLNYGVKLTNNLGNLNSALSSGDFSPTDQDINVKNELIEKVNKQLEIYDTIISNDIPSI